MVSSTSDRTPKPPRPSLLSPSLRAFTTIYAGQVVSVFGTAMTGFALMLFVWQRTGSATALALMGLAFFVPGILFTPVAGALVDRWEKKHALVVGDLAAATATTAILLLYATGQLQVYQLYIAGAFVGLFESFHFPAYGTVVSVLVPKEQLGRASGLIGTAGSVSGIFAPPASAGVLAVGGLAPVLIFDVCSAAVAVLLVLGVSIPRPKESAAGREAKGSLLKESAYGFRYIRERPSLLGVQMVFFSFNLVAMLGITLSAPMVLARTGNDAFILAAVSSAGAIGAVAGGVAMSLWGGPKRRVYGVLGGMVAGGFGGLLLMGLGRSFPVWAAASFIGQFLIPIVNGSNQALWQSKVPPDLQGRVFAVRRVIAQISIPVGTAIAGPLADVVFEPGLAPGGVLVPIFGGVVGTGPGAGMAALFLISGAICVIIGAAGFLVRKVRDVGSIVPDHDAA
jgi:predicted MFS family arabinose efflux permease